MYHVMARGDGGKMVIETDDDRLVFLKRLEETCGASWLGERLVCGVKRDRKLERRVNELVELLQCANPRDSPVPISKAHENEVT